MKNDFITLGVCEELASILKKNNITTPTPVQQQSIPILLTKKDLIVQAQTGTGKTLAFLLPMIQQIQSDKPWVQAIIISPTRELALQITQEVSKLVSSTNINVLATYGGQDVEKQINKLKGIVHIIIGTPGRLVDHMTRKSADYSKVSMLILDEADQIMDMGFFSDVEKIIHQTPQKRQTMLFSATITKNVRKLAVKFMKKPEQVLVHSKNVTLDKIKQLVIQTSSFSKRDALCKYIDEENPFMAIIFCKTRQRASDLNIALGKLGYDTDELQGDMQQSQRKKVLKKFRDLKLKLLVATDIAARGLDIDGITHIINYDMPPDAESYIHRIGRTGRAGQDGTAITFETYADRENLKIIEEGIRCKLERRKIIKGDLPPSKYEQTGYPKLEDKKVTSNLKNSNESRHDTTSASSSRNSKNRSSSARGAFTRNNSTRSSSARDNSTRGSSPRDNYTRSAAPRDSFTEDSSARNNSTRGSSDRDSFTGDSSPRDNSSRSSSPRYNSTRSSTRRDNSTRGSSVRNNSTRSSSPIDNSTRGSSDRDSFTGDSSPRYNSTRGSSARDNSTRGSSARDNSTRGSSARDNSTRSSSPRDNSTRSSSARDNSTRGSSARDNSTRGSSARDNSTRSSSARDNSTHTSSTRRNSTRNYSPRDKSTQRSSSRNGVFKSKLIQNKKSQNDSDYL